MLMQGVENHKLKGYKIKSRSPSLTHVQFADDTILFGQATIGEVKEIKDILGLYSAASGQKVNPNKSGILFSANTPFLVRR